MNVNHVFNTPAVAAVLACVAVSLFPTTAHAQWTVTNLHPNGMNASRANGVHGGQQVGHVGIWSDLRAVYWSGSSHSIVHLHSGPGVSIAYATNNGMQVGTMGSFESSHATLWYGTAESAVNLNPPGAVASVAYGISGAQQVGEAYVDGAWRASLWSGTAESWIKLHPEPAGLFGFASSRASATTATQQVGSVHAQFSLNPRAVMWSGTAESMIVLHPVGFNWSDALGIAGNQQVGYAGGDEFSLLASLWNGTAESWVSLHPIEAEQSIANDTTGSHQVGWAEVDGIQRASMWSGTAESWEDLSLALAGAWSSTEATGIWNDDSFIYISGYGFNLDTNRREALLWTRAIPAPGSVGLLAFGGLMAARRRR